MNLKSKVNIRRVPSNTIIVEPGLNVLTPVEVDELISELESAVPGIKVRAIRRQALKRGAPEAWNTIAIYLPGLAEFLLVYLGEKVLDAGWQWWRRGKGKSGRPTKFVAIWPDGRAQTTITRRGRANRKQATKRKRDRRS